MKITINTRTGQYKEEPTAREQKNTEQEDYELQALIMKTFCSVLATKIMEGKTPNQRVRMKEDVFKMLNGFVDQMEDEAISHV